MFGLSTEGRPFTPAEDAEHQAFERMREINVRMGKMNEDLETAETARSERVALEVAVSDLRTQITALQTQKLLLEKSNKQEEAVLQATRFAIGKGDEELGLASQDYSQRQEVLRTLEQKVSTAQTLKGNLDTQIAVGQKEIDALNDHISRLTQDASQQKDQIDVSISTLKGSVAGLQKELSVLEERKELILKEQETLQGQIDGMKYEVIQAQNAVRDAKLDAEHAVQDAKEKSGEQQQEIAKLSEQLDKKGADISLRESFLVDKTKQLIEVKRELEKFYNRPIPHIIF